MTRVMRHLDPFVCGKAPAPVTCRNGLVIGGGPVVPERNFTLPPMDINQDTWPEVRAYYAKMIRDVIEHHNLENP